MRAATTAHFSVEPYARKADRKNDNVVTHSAFSAFVVREPTHHWRDEVKQRLEKLARLPVGWDGYSGRPVAFENILFAMSLLESVGTIDFPAPSIAPGSNGDLQIEWHTASTDIELHILRPNVVHGWRCTPQHDVEGEELMLTTNFRSVAQWLKEMSETIVAASAAAA